MCAHACRYLGRSEDGVGSPGANTVPGSMLRSLEPSVGFVRLASSLQDSPLWPV